MRIAVLAANGRLGRVVVAEALRRGHTVRAGVRGDYNFPKHPNLTVLPCDATNIEDVTKLLDGQQAVVSTIGHVKGSAPDVQTKATEVVIQVMNSLNITRFVDVTGTGVRFPGDKITLTDRLLNLAVRIVDPNRVNDGIEHMNTLQKSSIDWTSIRVLKLQNVKPRMYALRLHGPTKRWVGREEVACAMLEVLEQDTFIHEAPIISYTEKE